MMSDMERSRKIADLERRIEVLEEPPGCPTVLFLLLVCGFLWAMLIATAGHVGVLDTMTCTVGTIFGLEDHRTCRISKALLGHREQILKEAGIDDADDENSPVR